MPRILEHFLNKLNSLLDAEFVMSESGATHIQHCGSELRAGCPVHGSDRQRSLAVKYGENVCMCHNTGCPAHKGGSLLWLYALTKGITIRESAEYWARRINFTLEYEDSRPQPEEFQFKELGGISEDGKFWRNRLVTASQPPTSLQESSFDLFQSVFRYNISGMKELRAALRKEEAFLFGRFYCDFDNPFPGLGKEQRLQRTPFNEITTFNNGAHHAKEEAIIATKFLLENGVPQKALFVYFSGRGFHLEVDPRVFGVRPSTDLHHIYRELACCIAGVKRDKEKIALEFDEKGKCIKQAYPAKLQTLDQTIYNSDRLWRVPNTINTKSSKYKIALHVNELMGLTTHEILLLSLKPRERIPVAKHLDANPKIRQLFIKAWKKTQLHKNKSGNPEHQIKNNGYELIRMDKHGKITQGFLPSNIIGPASKKPS